MVTRLIKVIWETLALFSSNKRNFAYNYIIYVKYPKVTKSDFSFIDLSAPSHIRNNLFDTSKTLS